MTQVMPAMASSRSSSQSRARRSKTATPQRTSNIAAATERSASVHRAVWGSSARSSASRWRRPVALRGRVQRRVPLERVRGDDRDDAAGHVGDPFEPQPVEVDAGLLLEGDP